MKRVDVNPSDATEELYGKVEKKHLEEEEIPWKIVYIPL